jgi:hypothetical protein
MTTLWPWLTEWWREQHLPKRAALLAHLPWPERWVAQQAVPVQSKGDMRGGSHAAEAALWAAITASAMYGPFA